MKTAEEIYRHIDKFTSIYVDGKEENPLPKGVKLTVFCSNGSDYIGFVENITEDEMGLELLVAQKWILQSELDKL